MLGPSSPDTHGLIKELRRKAAIINSQADRIAALTASGATPTSKEARALALLVEHPDWTDRQIAKHVPCHPKSLYRWRLFVAARKAAKQGSNDLPHGTKYPDDDGSSQVEAWDSDQA